MATLTRDEAFDAIVVGARVAGSATAFALAQRGWRVALVERRRRPLGGTLSLPITHPRGLALFRELGLMGALERVAGRMKQARTYRLELGAGLVMEGAEPEYAGFDYGMILRREVFDDALLDVALEGEGEGIRLYAGRAVAEVTRDGEGVVNGVRLTGEEAGEAGETLRAPLVIGADGRFSRVAQAVGARMYNTRRSYTTLFYSYCRGMELDGLADLTFMTAPNQRLLAVAEAGEGLQVVSAWFPVGQFRAFQRGPMEELRATWLSHGAFAERTRGIELVGKVMGLSPQDGYFREAGGAGWALVGDARHFKDPASGQGFHDALYSTRQLVATLERVTGGGPLTMEAARRRWPEAIARTQRESDRALQPMYAFTYTFGEGLTRPPTFLERALLTALCGDATLTRRFLGISSGATDVRAFNRAAPLYLARGLVAMGRRRG